MLELLNIDLVVLTSAFAGLATTALVIARDVVRTQSAQIIHGGI